MTGASRTAHALVALAAIAGLVLHYLLVLQHPGEIALRSIRYISFFTILTNGLVAAAAIGRVLPEGHRAARLVLPAQRTQVTLHILVVALIFHLLLRHTLPGALGWWANLFVHSIVPAGWVLCWLGFGPHGGIDRAAPWRWMVYPLLFALWTLAHGAIGGWYPYPFMDVARFGYPAVLRNILCVALVFLTLGHALRWIDARLSR